jgi:hypothetical protein
LNQSIGFVPGFSGPGQSLLTVQYPDESGLIRRADRVPCNPPGLSRFQENGLHQGRIERILLDSLREHSTIEVERAVLPEELELDSSKSEDFDVYPVKVKVRHLDDEASLNQNDTIVPNGLFQSNLVKDDESDWHPKARRTTNSTETIRAKYVIGCDGAHSWTRRQLGINMEGKQTEFIWGVLDIIPVTDFRMRHQSVRSSGRLTR